MPAIAERLVMPQTAPVESPPGTIVDLQIQGIETVGENALVHTQRTIIGSNGEREERNGISFGWQTPYHVYFLDNRAFRPLVEVIRRDYPDAYIGDPIPSGITGHNEWVLPKAQIPGLSKVYNPQE